MIRSIILYLAFTAAVAASAIALATRIGDGNCQLLVLPCDNKWQSRMNQTFAFQAAGPFVQIMSFWGNYDACLSQDLSSFYYKTCSEQSSLWSYGPNTIQSWVYYNNTRDQCLSRTQDPVNSIFGNGMAYGLDLANCCLDHQSRSINNCTLDQVARQMWLEPPTRHNPYSRFVNKAQVSGAPNGMCLTRISDSC